MDWFDMQAVFLQFKSLMNQKCLISLLSYHSQTLFKMLKQMYILSDTKQSVTLTASNLVWEQKKFTITTL
jgi:hypothetical protein